MRSNCHSILTSAFGALMIIVASNAGASFQGDDLFIPAVGRGPGASGSSWYTTVWIHNPGATEATVTISLLLRGQPNPTPEIQVFAVPTGSSVTFEDAIQGLFGLDQAAGAFRIQSTAPVAVGSRIFNQPGDTISESQGQYMAGIPANFAVKPGQLIEVPGIYHPADHSFRSNFGFVETSGTPAQVDVTLLDGTGLELASKSYSLGPYSAFQRPLTNLAPDTVVAGGILRIEVNGTSGAVLAYASAVANGVISQDPTTLDMTLDPLLLGGITGIEAGPGLAGGGSEGLIFLQVLAGVGIEVGTSGVSIEEHGITRNHIAPGEIVLGTKIGSDVLRDVVTFEAGNNVNVVADDNTVSISAFGCFGQRQEAPVTQALVADSPGDWFVGDDHLNIPAAGRWRIGYRVLIEVRNSGLATLTEPVNVALYDSMEQDLVRNSLSVFGLQVDLNSSVYTTVNGDVVVEVGRPTTIRLMARTSSNDLAVTIHPNDVDLSTNLPNPDAASFFYIECLHLND